MALVNAKDFGAVGDGSTDDTVALQDALEFGALRNKAVFLPSGVYLITRPLALSGWNSSVALYGESSNASIIKASNTSVLTLDFDQSGVQQPYGLNLRDVGFQAQGQCGHAIRVSYGNPAATSDHFRPSTTIRGVAVTSGDAGSWANGIDIEAAWNVTMDDVYVSGDPYGGNWNAMSGAGITFRRMCVNAHLTNVRTNFWATGFFYSAENGGNTEGLFFSNCSMVGVQRGVWIRGNAAASAPRVSTLTWQGGMIECRVGGVTGGSAAFHLENVWTALINGAQLLAETLPATHTTYGLFLDNCHGVSVSGCDINAWHNGLFTVGDSRAIVSCGNTYTNTERANVFNSGTTRSRSYGHVSPWSDVNDFDADEVNKIGFTN